MTLIPFLELSRFYKSVALKFIQKYEISCVQLAAHIRKSGKNVFVAFLDNKASPGIYGIFSLNKTILHCLPFTSDPSSTKNNAAIQEEFSTSLAALIKTGDAQKQDDIHCVNGTYYGSLVILNALKKRGKMPFQINQYDLLKLDFEKFSKIHSVPFQNGERIFRFKKNMNEWYRLSLQSLQNEYEKEEVLPVGTHLDEASCRLRLSNAIRTQCVLALELPSKNSDNSTALSVASPSKKRTILVAKAATNAVGFQYAQIGGVYTASNYRGRHYAFNIVFALLKKICKMKRIPVLFVKKSNKSAQHLYKTLGFYKISDYMIAYF